MSNPDPTSPAASTPPTSVHHKGEKLAGCYTLDRQVSAGEGVEVWLAHDEVLGKDVSLHFVSEQVRKDVRAMSELRLDVKRNRQLIHPNILRVYDLVEEPDFVAISMDTFSAESLAERLGKAPEKTAKLGEVKGWAGQLAQTLEEAHKINVLHADLAPSHIFLNDAGKLLVANFGIGRTLREALKRATSKQASETAFQSPEVIDGAAPTRADDVYSFGAVLFSALTGSVPVTGNDLAAAVRAGVSAEKLALLGKEELGLPENWRKTITACLEKTREARPQSAGELGERLQSATTATPLTATVPASPTTKSAAVETGSLISAAVAAAATGAAASIAAKSSAPEKLAASESISPSKAAETARPEPRKSLEATKSSAPTSPAKTPERPANSDFSPRLYPEKTKFPLGILAAAAAAIIVLALIFRASNARKTPNETAAATPQPEQAELRALSTPAPASSAAPAVAIAAAPATSPAPTSTPAVKEQGSAKAIAEKAAALAKAKEAVQAADKTYAETLQQSQTAEAVVAAIQKTIEEKSKGAELLKQTANEVAAQQAKLREEQAMREAAVAEAQKAAAEKVRLAEENKKALADLEKASVEKLAAPQNAETELVMLRNTLAEKQKTVSASAQAVSAAEAAKQQHVAAISQSEQEIERLKAGDLEAQRQREAAEAQRTKLDQEVAEMQRMFKEKMADLEAKRKMLENPEAVPTNNPPAQKAAATPAPALPPAASNFMPSAAAALDPAKLASLTTNPSLTIQTNATSDAANVNSLGLKFARVGDVEFSVWQTRVKDFEVFAKAVNLKSTGWKGPGFKQGPDHPVVNVSWQEAIAFCKWLTDKEHRENTLPAAQFYRLPTDLEWSKAVGLGDESGKTPEVRDMGIPDQYPWGKTWPPPSGAGNYTGEETNSDVAIKGYDDGFAWTSPVGSFPPNSFGLYDMGGNVWQWCMDTWNTESKAKVLRGASWYNGALKLSLLSSCRVHAAPDSSTDNYGFRVVRAADPKKVGKK